MIRPAIIMAQPFIRNIHLAWPLKATISRGDTTVVKQKLGINSRRSESIFWVYYQKIAQREWCGGIIYQILENKTCLSNPLSTNNFLINFSESMGIVSNLRLKYAVRCLKAYANVVSGTAFMSPRRPHSDALFNSQREYTKRDFF